MTTPAKLMRAVAPDFQDLKWRYENWKHFDKRGATMKLTFVSIV